MIKPHLIPVVNDLEPAFGQATQQIGGVIHLAVAIGDAGKVERGLLQAERGGLVGLAIPKQLEDI